MTANALTAAILLAATERFNGHVVLWRSNVVKAMAIGRGGKPRMITAGIEGQGDLTGILPHGRRCEIEVKIGRDRMSEKQEAFRRMIMSRGGVYIIARDLETCMAELVAEVERTRI